MEETMNAAEEKNKIIDENAIDILRDERMMINSTIRGEANMRWGVSAALLYITLIIYHFSLASHSVFILGASLICNSIISIAIIITNVYFERCGVINCYHLLKVDNDINRLMGREILYYNRKYARFGISPIGEIGNIKKWRQDGKAYWPGKWNGTESHVRQAITNEV